MCFPMDCSSVVPVLRQFTNCWCNTAAATTTRAKQRLKELFCPSDAKWRTEYTTRYTAFVERTCRPTGSSEWISTRRSCFVSFEIVDNLCRGALLGQCMLPSMGHDSFRDFMVIPLFGLVESFMSRNQTGDFGRDGDDRATIRSQPWFTIVLGFKDDVNRSRLSNQWCDQRRKCASRLA